MGTSIRLVSICTGLWCISFATVAQQSTIDSLEQRAESAIPEEQPEMYLQLCYQAEKTDNEQAVHYADQAIKAARAVSDTVHWIEGLMKHGGNNFFLGNYQQALSDYHKARDLNEEIGDQAGVALTLNEIGTLVKRQGDVQKSLEYYKQAMEIASQAGDTAQVANSMNNMGIVFDVTGQLDKAMQYFKESAGMKERMGDINGLTYNLDNMGMVTAKQGKFEESARYFKRAIELRKQLGDTRMLGILYNNLGEMQLMRGDVSAAEQNFQQALDIAQMTSYHHFRQHIYGMLSDIEARRNNYAAALDYFKMKTTLNDSLFNAQRSRQLAEMEAKYETRKKEQQLEIQRAQIAEQRTTLQRNFILLISLAVVLGLVLVVWWLVRNQTKKKQQLQLREAQINAALISQEEERKRFARDLHDSLGQLISTCRLQVSQLGNGGPAVQKAPVIAERSEQVLDEMHQEIRNITFNLMPSTLIQQGLVDAVKELAMRINRMNVLHVAVSDFDISERLPEQHEVAVYRVIQEWINNVMKHADADSMEIQLVGYDDEIVVTLEDDGRGFDPAVLAQSEGNGWKNIQSRLGMLEAEIEVDSTEGVRGTTVILEIPKKAVHQRSISASA